MVKVRLFTNDDGYLVGWGTDYTEDNQHDIPQDELDSMAIGACKLEDGHIVTDTAKQAELVAAEQANQPINYEAKIAELEAKLQEATNATLELADTVLGGDTNDASAS